MKVDKGFELLYYNLSYRRKFIRTVWIILFGVLLFGTLHLSGASLGRSRIFLLMAVIVAPIQLIYNYSKWKEEERNNNE